MIVFKNSFYSIIFTSAIFFVFVIDLSAGFNEKYEPPDGRIIHGLGQYFPVIYTDQENWQYVADYQLTCGRIPVIYSVYKSIDSLLDISDNTNLNDIVSNHGYPYILLIGLSLFDTSSLHHDFNIPVENILNGDCDRTIIKLARQIRDLKGPVFLRPGFEFGSGNDGFHRDPDMSAAEFKLIWQHIYDLFNQQNVRNAAWVWNTVNPHLFNYLEWYPGNEYVDWWGINFFTSSQIYNAKGFLDNAKLHSKPVIICESNPIQNNGTSNSQNWTDWFIPYFNIIKSHINIKAFVYIDDPWDRGYWENWPDSRISINTIISNNYRLEMNDSVYIHMSEFQENPEIIVGISNQKKKQLKSSILLNNYPNPFNNQTRITYVLSNRCLVAWQIYSCNGQLLIDKKLGLQSTGTHYIDLNLENITNQKLASGVYYFHLINDKQINIIRMLLIK